MKIKVIKPHSHYKVGEHEVPEDRGNYLINTGIAEKVAEKVNNQYVKEKVEVKKAKEKAENKTRNVPTAKKKNKR